MKKSFSLGMIAVVCVAVLSACGTKTVENDAPVMKIGDEMVVKAEYQMIVDRYRSNVTRQYTTEEINQENFWTTEHKESVRPVDEVMELALKDITQKKVIAQLAKNAGTVTDTDYLSILEQMGVHNEESIYGLSNFEIDDYYAYVYTGIEAEYIESYKKEHPVSEEELKAVYEENIAEYTSEVCVDMLVVEVPVDEDAALLKEISKDMAEETDIHVLTKNYPQGVFYNIRLSSLNMQEGKSGIYMNRYLVASEMQKDEICEPFFVADKVLVMRCLERMENAVQPFEEVKGVLESDVLTSNAKAYIRQETENAEVIMEDVDLEKIALEILEGE
ncbi:MAG: peptidyl-prolyl cis-trans isomerase [Lachnospiraceae bacterium]|nr:peptidyl-prolyl cis-trans isomerase [Lachnospiraceae bacterium]